MKAGLIICFYLISSAIFLGPALAQESRDRGEIRDTEFIIRKDRVLSLPQQPRIYERPPSLPAVSSQGNYTYEVKNFQLDLQPVELNIQPFAKSFPKPVNEQYHSFVRAGFGNYMSPLAEIQVNSLASDELTYGLKLKHQGFYEGPVDGSNSAEDHSAVKINVSLFKEDMEIFGDVGYERDRYNFYGYATNPVLEATPFDLEQVFNTVTAQLGVRKIDQLDLFTYDGSLNFRIFNDNYLAREHEANIQASAGFRANENLAGGIATQLFFTSPSDAFYSDINRNYFKLQPYATYAKDKFRVKVGASVVQENDIVPNKTSDFNIFPLANISYQIDPTIGAYASFEGDVIRNTYYGFVMENPFLGPSAQLRNTIQNYEIDAGITGTINGEINYKAGVKYGNFTNMHFYGNNENDSTRFQLIYDDMSRVLNYHISTDWNYEGWYQLEASANYYQYTLTDFSSPWHRPEWEIKLHNRFQPDKKWLIHVNTNVMGGIPVINLASDTTDTLPALIDVQAKIDYRISTRLSVFAIGNNLLNQSYQRFWNYPVRGIQGIGGVSFKF